jgi:iron-sulfur cluster repair protein YtfE (RIC family)
LNGAEVEHHSKFIRGEMMIDNILTLLKSDHRAVADILKKLADTSEAAIKTRERLFLTLKNELTLHEKFEEEVFYPAIKENVSKHSDTKNLVMEAYQEHHVADILMAEMEQLSFDNEAWTAKLTVLKENIEHHVDEEENKLFPHVNKILTNEKLQEIGKQLKEWKEKAE